ncbi:hypothetical protein JCM3774_001611 [Rhodotorula dairenensis]
MPPFAALPRTAVHAWCPAQLQLQLHRAAAEPYLVTGTVSGALDDSFSTDSQLELWQPFAATDAPLAAVQLNARFNRLAWGTHSHNGHTPLGVIAAGLEDGGVSLWDPAKLVHSSNTHDGRDGAAAAAAAQDSLIARLESPHRGPVRGLDFSPAQSNLLATGATNGEIYIWDLTSPAKPFSPGTRSRSLDSITSLAWNPSVVHILASSSNTGHTVVWDLKSKREITALSFASGGATGLGAGGFGIGPGGGGGGLGAAGFGGLGGGPGGAGGGAGAAGIGGLGGHSAVKWHPDNPTKLVTASEDDHAPNLLVWDLRNWKQPEKILRGHDKGILSVNFCPADSDLLLSSGKDGRTLAWSLTSGEIVAEVTPSSNWAFESHFVPTNPSLISAAALDGELYLHSLQSANAPAHDDTAANAASEQSQAPAGANDFFEQAISANAKNYPTKSLTVEPKWLRRPASVAFGFGGRLVRVSSALGPKVQIDRVVTVPGVVERAEKLEKAATGQEEGGLAKFCDDRAGAGEWEEQDDLSPTEKESWLLLKTLFRAAAGGPPGSGGPAARERLVEMLGGFDREELKVRVDDLVKELQAKLPSLPGADGGVEREASPAVSMTSPGETTTTVELQQQQQQPDKGDASEASLFGGDAGNSAASGLNGFPDTGANGGGGDDFFASLGQQQTQNRPSALPDRLLQQQQQQQGGQDASSSIAATLGSGPSSLKSLNLKPSTFKLFQDNASEADRLVTQSLVLGDFASAVELALSTERYADALLFALQSASPELVSSVQHTYFARATADRPYLRVLESISATTVGGGGRDLADVIQNADLEQNWREAFVVACTYAASDDDFSSLVEQLGQRLEYQFELVRGRAGPAAADEWRKNAVLCYLAAGKLEKVVGVWVQQMKEDEQARLASDQAAAANHGGSNNEATSATARFEAHSRALQAFIEKVQVFQHAVGYVDVELANPTESAVVAETGARIYKLASLYDRYIEYAELLANQGKVNLALQYVAKTPADYDGTNSAVSANAMKRERLLRASSAQAQTGRAPAGHYGSVGAAGGAGRYAQNTNPYGLGNAAPVPQAQGAYSNPLASSARSAYASPYSAAPAPAAAPATAYNPYAPAPAVAAAPSLQPARNPYAPAQPLTNPHDDPYAPAPSASGSSALPAAAQPPATAAPGSGSYAPPTMNAGVAYAQTTSHDPYGPSTASNPGVGLPAPPPMRTESPNYAGRNAAAGANVPPPPRAKPAGGWNDVPTLPAPRRNTPAPSITPSGTPAKPSAITSPFPNSSPVGTPPLGPGQVPPPPPSRGANRTPAPVPPPPMTGHVQQPPRFAPPPPTTGRVLSPPPANSSQYAPAPPANSSQYAPTPPQPFPASLGPHQGPSPGQNADAAGPGQGGVVAPPPPMASQRSGPVYAAPPPPRTGTPSAPPPPRANPAAAAAPPQPSHVDHRGPQPPAPPSFPAPNGSVASRPPPPPMASAPFAKPPPAPSGHLPNGAAAPSPPMAPQQPHPPPPPRSHPTTPQTQSQAFPPVPPPPMSARAGPPHQAPPQPHSQALNPGLNQPPALSQQQQLPPQSPRAKYPPGDRSHIPAANRPIFDTLSAELSKLRQTTPPQQVKIVNDTEKRLNILFDMLNCETLSEASTKRLSELCQAIQARNQSAALDLHLQLITSGATDVTPFQAAVKLLVQRMMIPAPPQQ